MEAELKKLGILGGLGLAGALKNARKKALKQTMDKQVWKARKIIKKNEVSGLEKWIRKNSARLSTLLESPCDILDSTLLHRASRKAVSGMAEMLIDAGAKADAPNKHGTTPLIFSVLFGNPALTEKMIDSIVSRRSADCSSNNPANESSETTKPKNNEEGSSSASESQKKEKGAGLLEKHADISLVQAMSCPIFTLILPKLEQLVGKDALETAARTQKLEINAKGSRLLHVAVRGSMTDTVEWLLKCGADPNIRDKRGRTPLYVASKASSQRVVNMLLEFGADPTIAKPSRGRTPFMVAAAVDAPAMIAMATHCAKGFSGVDKDGTMHPVDMEALSKLVNATDNTGSCALFHATANNNPNSVDFLLRLGVPLDCFYSGKRSPLLCAAVSMYRANENATKPSSLSLFSSLGSTNRVDEAKKCGLSRECLDKMVAYLFARRDQWSGENATRSNPFTLGAADESLSPLHIMAKMDLLSVILCKVLAAGTDPNFAVGDGKFTPLLFSLADPQTTTPIILLQHGADPHLTDAKGTSGYSLFLKLPDNSRLKDNLRQYMSNPVQSSAGASVAAPAVASSSSDSSGSSDPSVQSVPSSLAMASAPSTTAPSTL